HARHETREIPTARGAVKLMNIKLWPRVPRRACRNASICGLESQLRVDAVEKVLGIAALRNNRIMADDFLTPSCVFGAYLELILLGDPLKFFFRKYRPKRDIRDIG